MLTNAKFHHVGVAAESIEKTAKLFTEAGYKMTNVIFDPMQNVNISFLEKPDSPLLELVEPVDEKSPVRNILNKVGVSAYHFCYEAENLDDSIAELRKKKFMLLVKPVEAVAFDGRKICFLYHKDAGLIELLEK
jgi:methylmalonyl-CoA/ethylmalonyl-CoA epimerase